METFSSNEAPYTVLTRSRKLCITAILTLAMLASPLTATIYLPLLPILTTNFNTSVQAINLTITIYIIFQGISPLLLATASDHFGRRPILLVTYTIYTFASLGLALNKHSYSALLVLRALQSLGASAVLAVAFGVVADVSPPAERGSMLGPTQGAANVAVCLGPIIGGFVAQRDQSVTWVFWALFFFGGFVWILITIALPETARNVVGNGSKPTSSWNSTCWDMFRRYLRSAAASKDDNINTKGNDLALKGNPRTDQVSSTIEEGKLIDKLKKTNPILSIRIIFWLDTAPVLWMAASPYAVWYCVQASIPHIYQEVYHFSELQTGFAFLTGGVAVVVGGFANGKLMDWNYKRVALRSTRSTDGVANDDLANFPIEKARARGSLWLLAVYTVVLIGYGWSVEREVHESIPLTLQFVLAVLCTAFQQTYNALLVDLFPTSPSTASASSNITRCLLSAIFLAALQPAVGAIGRGWLFSTLGLVGGGSGTLCYFLISIFGTKCRHKRLGIAERSRSQQ